jgi:Zn-dependent protease with chaperone function
LSYVVSDDHESLQLARRALELENHGYNETAVVQSLLRFSDVRSRREARDRALKLMELLPTEPNALAVTAAAAIAYEDRALLGKAVDGLRKLEPDGMTTHYFAGIVAALDEDWEKAEEELLLAQARGVPAEEIQRLLRDTGIHGRARAWRYLRYAGYGTAGWIAGLGILFGWGVLMSAITLRAIQREPPQTVGTPSGASLLLRRLYALLLGVSSLYYYISIPIVVLLVLGAGGGVLYGILTHRLIPLKLVVVIVAIIVVTVVGLLRSLFLRVRREDPGLRLEPHEAPDLFAALSEVAGRVGTPPVDSVFVVPDATIAVFERGSPFQHLGKPTERCLVLGLGALEGMTQLQFKAILGHEYGHLSNRDTAGGRIALHVRRSILASAESLARGGAATWYNPAWLFLLGFHGLYLRISHGASRLQEVLADRWAAFAYGAQAFASGLRHVVRRGIEFQIVSGHEIQLALKQARPFANLYRLPVPSQFLPDEEPLDGATTPAHAIDQAFEKAMDDPGSPFDSHPAPGRRIEWVGKLSGTASLPDDRTEVWQLLPGKEKLQELMTERVRAEVMAMLSYQQALEGEATQT